MQIFIKTQSIERKAKLSTYLMYGGFAILVVTLLLSFSLTEGTAILGLAALIAFIISQYGIILKNRWGRRPRVDEIIDQSLKGLDSNYTLFHYELGANHVLITPAGPFALVPAIHDGTITFEDGKWWQIREKRGGETKRRQSKLTTDADLEVRALIRSLQRKLPDQLIPEVKAILIFLHPNAVVKAEHAPIHTAHVKKLKPLIRKLGKGPTLDDLQIEMLADSAGY